MIFEQIVWRDLGCASYLVGCQVAGEAVVVDPPLDVREVLALCKRHGAKLVGVIETHTHADHVSGHGVLAQHHGCWIAIHEIANAVYEHRPLRDGDRIDVGNIALDVFHTPGHRPEHCCIVVSDRTRGDEPWFVLSGDALFVGDSGRPDLAIAGDEGAAVLYRSLHERLGALDNGVELYPGHVAGSLCGRGMSAKTSSTLGFERRFNPMLADMAVEQFVQRANADLAPKPPTMARIVEMNRGPLIGEAPSARTARLPAADDQVLDVRDGAAFAGGHMAGSFNDSAGMPGFGNRCGFVLDAERELMIVAGSHEQAEDAVRKLAAVGFTKLAEVAFGIDGAHAHTRFDPIGLVEMGQLSDKGELQVVDIREASEQTELAAGAVAVPYRLLAHADLSLLDPAKPTAVVCHTGTRSPLGASLLARRGFTHVRPVLGEGMDVWHTREAVAAAAAEAAADKAQVRAKG
ncbi:MAG: hydroxyacylglutathione hydrolase [Gaiellales bacterium]|nr:hydroxyacylglutathione hydrolase [Gaiellales bacterium]